MGTRLRLTAAATAACLILVGCATETRTEREFGDSVRAVATSQIHDMGAAQYPDKNAVTGGNGDRIEAVIKAHSEATSEANSVKSAPQAGVTRIGQ